MDNEEIRELLRELKESSDEGHSVKSRVVKIHFDTPKEAAQREKAKKRAEDEAQKKRQEEEEEQARRKEEAEEAARKEAEKAVREAKEEAARSFGSRLDQELQEADAALEKEADADTDEDTDLRLDWGPRAVHRPGDLLKELEEEERSEQDQDEERQESASDEEAGNAPDETEGRSEGGSIFGRMKTGIGSLTRRAAAAFRNADAETEKAAQGDLDDETAEDVSETDSPSGGSDRGKKGSAGAGFEKTAEDSALDEDNGDSKPDERYGERTRGKDHGEKTPDDADDWKRRMEQPPRYNLRHVRIPDMPVKSWTPGRSGEEKADWSVQSREEDLQSDGKVRAALASDDAGAGEDLPSGADQKAASDAGRKEKKARGKKAASGRRLWIAADGTDLSLADFHSDEDEFREPGSEGEQAEEASAPQAGTRKTDRRRTDRRRTGGKLAGVFRRGSGSRLNQTLDNGAGENAEGSPDGMPDASSREETADDLREGPGSALKNELQNSPEAGTEGAAGKEAQDSPGAEAGDAAPKEAQDGLGAGAGGAAGKKSQDDLDTGTDAASGKGPQEDPGTGADGLPGGRAARKQSIEVVNLNESANNRLVEVIDVDKAQTGPLPHISQASSHTAKGSGAEAQGKAGIFSKIADAGRGTGTWIGAHRLPAAAILAAAAVLIIVLALSARSGPSSQGGAVAADEGLTVSIRKQPEEYTTSGDVTLLVRAPETIQSITADGEAAEFTGDRRATVTVRATKSTISLMVVCTDKVRNAEVQLKCVDSESPVVSVSESGGTVTLSAQDDLSGVAGIYYGKAEGLSDVPQYQEYTQPFVRDEDAVYSWYAVDKAGNASTPQSGTFTEAENISFERASYRLFLGENATAKVDTAPAGSFTNDLQIRSGDENVVRIEQGNVLVPVSAGETTITASAEGLQDAVSSVTVSRDQKITFTAVGDCTLGTDPSFSPQTSFNAYQTLYGDSYFFENVRDVLSADDVTIANCEGALTDSEDRQNKTFTFKGDPAYANILADGSVEAASLANNHSGDYGDEGLADTKKSLEDAGIVWCDGDDIGNLDVGGATVACIGIYAVENGLQSLDQVKSTIAEARRQGASVVVVYFHWNSELVQEPNEDMVTLGHAAIDAGADLVVGSHSHIVSAIENYGGKYIVYGLGNFLFGGNSSPADFDAIMFRQTFTLTSDGTQDDDAIQIIPVSVSSQSGMNNYQPTLLSGDDAQRVLDKINSASAQFGQTWDEYLSDGSTDASAGGSADASSDESADVSTDASADGNAAASSAGTDAGEAAAGTDAGETSAGADDAEAAAE